MNDNIISDATGHYLAGLIDGEGCFLIVGKLPRPDMGAAMRIELHADDAEILHQLQQETGLGKVKSKRSPSLLSPHVVWEITNQRDCLDLIGILDAYPLRAKKRHDYSVWKEFVLWWTAHKMGEDWAHGLTFKNKLTTIRSATA